MPPVHRTPLELLRLTFLCLHATWEDEQDGSGSELCTSGSKAPPVLYIRHVCRRWLALGDDMPELWNALLVLNAGLHFHMIELALERTKCAPLSVDIEVPRAPLRYWNQSVDLLLAQHHRIESLNITLRERSPEKIETIDPTAVLSSSTFRLLKALRIECGKNREYTFDHSAFSNTVPKALKDLTLLTCQLKDTFTVFRAPLTRACFHDCDFGPTVSSVVDVLQKMPTLESLTLLGVRGFNVIPVSEYRRNQATLVTFNLLRHFCIAGRVGHVFDLCTLIARPDTCATDVYLNFVHTPDADTAVMCTALDAAFRRGVCGASTQLGFKELSIDYNDDEEDRPSVEISLRKREVSTGPETFRLCLITDSNRAHTLRSLVLHVVNTWSALRAVERVVGTRLLGTEGADGEIDDRFWAKILKPLRMVRTISVQDDFAGLPLGLKCAETADFPPYLEAVEVKGLNLSAWELAMLVNALRRRVKEAHAGPQQRIIYVSHSTMDDMRVEDFEVRVEVGKEMTPEDEA